MKALRRSLAAVGVVSLGLGLASLAVRNEPTLAAAATVLGNDYLFLVPLGAVGVLAVVGALGRRSIRGVDQAEPPDPEGVPTADRPGASFDRLVAGPRYAVFSPPRGDRERVEERLREAAVRTVMRSSNRSHHEASRCVDRGEWTADAVAADFLGREGSASTSGWRPLEGFPLGGRSFRQQVTRTVQAIERHGGRERS